MDPSKSLDYYTERRDLLRSFLDEYALLAQEYPSLAQSFGFESFVQFSFAYFRISEQLTYLSQLVSEVEQLRSLLPNLTSA